MDQLGIKNMEERKKYCIQEKHCGCCRKKIDTESLKCKLCEFGTNIWFKFKKHQTEHYQKCSFCDFETNFLKKLNQHKYSQHASELPVHKCTNCIYSSTRKDLLRLHQKTHEEHEPLQCELCEYKCIGKKPFKNHQKHHTGKIIPCGLCNYKTDIERQLILHQKKMHPNPVMHKCDNCDYESKSIANVVKHDETVHQGVRIICYNCDRKFTQNSDLDKHMAKEHGIIPQNVFKCDMCEYQSKTRSGLVLHRANQHDGIVYYCDECSFSAKTVVDLGGHKSRKHYKLR